MKPLLVLLSAFGIAALVLYFMGDGLDLAYAGRIAMCTMVVFTGIAHIPYVIGMMVQGMGLQLYFIASNTLALLWLILPKPVTSKLQAAFSPHL